MNKKIIIAVSFVFIIIGGYLLSGVGLKFFFNDYLYETPNLKGLPLDKAEELLGDDFKLVNMGEGYSKFEKGVIYSQLPVSPKHIKHGRPIKIWISKGSDIVTIPDLKGLSLQDARVLLNDAGIKINTISHVSEDLFNNIVLGTDPKIGSDITRGSSISLLVNTNKAKDIRMPDILGYSLKDGENILRSKGLVLGDVSKVYNSEFPEGTIIDVSVPAGSKIFKGSVINIVVTTK